MLWQSFELWLSGDCLSFEFSANYHRKRVRSKHSCALDSLHDFDHTAYCLCICWQDDICVWFRCRAWVSLWQQWTRGSCRLSSRARRPSSCSCLLLMVTPWRAPGSSSHTPAPVLLLKHYAGPLKKQSARFFFWVLHKNSETRKLQLLFVSAKPKHGNFRHRLKNLSVDRDFDLRKLMQPRVSWLCAVAHMLP